MLSRAITRWLITLQQFALVVPSSKYCLDANRLNTTEHLDWICHGTTIAHIADLGISVNVSAADLVDEVNRSTRNRSLKALIVS